jgi:uncharacterized protein
MKALILSALLLAMPAYAGFTVPELPNPVNDYSGVLSTEGKEVIAAEVVRLRNDTKAQLGVLLVDTLDGDNLEASSMKVATAWKLGTAKEDNGILLFVVTKDRKMRIEVGQGLEGTVTDYLSKIILKDMKPYLKKGDWNEGILTGVKGISKLIRDAQTAPTEASVPAPVATATPTTDNSGGWGWLWFGFIAVIGAIWLMIWRSNKEQELRELELERQRRLARDAMHTKQRTTATPRGVASSIGRTIPVIPHPTVPVVAAAAVLAEQAEVGSRRRRQEQEEEEERSRRRRREADEESSRSSSSSSSYDSGGSSSSGSDWSGGGGGFSGGGSSDSF